MYSLFWGSAESENPLRADGTTGCWLKPRAPAEEGSGAPVPTQIPTGGNRGPALLRKNGFYHVCMSATEAETCQSHKLLFLPARLESRQTCRWSKHCVAAKIRGGSKHRWLSQTQAQMYEQQITCSLAFVQNPAYLHKIACLENKASCPNSISVWGNMPHKQTWCQYPC